MASRRDGPQPSAAIELALAHLPLERPAIEAVLLARGGNVVRCVDRDGGRYALKAIDTSASAGDRHDLTDDRAQALRHEADVLQTIERLHVASGQDGAVVWLLTRWLDGRPVARVAAELRRQGAQADFQPLATAIVASVAELHAAGYVHGDLQPAHCVLRDDGTVGLLDFELAHRPGDGTVDYRGALVHYAAPEIAVAMRARRFPIDYTPAAEIYSLGSLLCFLATGATSSPTYDPDRDLSLDEQLDRIIAGRRAPVATALAALIEPCLARDPAARPTAAQLSGSQPGRTRPAS